MLDALTMSDGRSIPAQGFGVFQIPAEQTADAVAQAIKVGYRHIDTAQSYFNEETVGEGIRRSGIDRSELFVTTKVWLDNYGEDATYASVKASLEKLGLGYVDLMLLHQPFNDVYGSWRALEQAQADGLIHSIGVWVRSTPSIRWLTRLRLTPSISRWSGLLSCKSSELPLKRGRPLVKAAQACSTIQCWLVLASSTVSQWRKWCCAGCISVGLWHCPSQYTRSGCSRTSRLMISL